MGGIGTGKGGTKRKKKYHTTKKGKEKKGCSRGKGGDGHEKGTRAKKKESRGQGGVLLIETRGGDSEIRWKKKKAQQPWLLAES